MQFPCNTLQAFVDALVLQSFMDLPNFNKLLMVMFALCNRLCTLLQARPATQSNLVATVGLYLHKVGGLWGLPLNHRALLPQRANIP